MAGGNVNRQCAHMFFYAAFPKSQSWRKAGSFDLASKVDVEARSIFPVDQKLVRGGEDVDATSNGIFSVDRKPVRGREDVDAGSDGVFPVDRKLVGGEERCRPVAQEPIAREERT